MTEDQLQRAITLDKQMVALRAHVDALERDLLKEYPDGRISLHGIEDRYVRGATEAVRRYLIDRCGELQHEFDTL